MFNKLFWQDALERALKAFAQTLLAVIGAAGTTNVVAFDWPTLLLTAVGAALISLLTSLVSGAATRNEPTLSPASLVKDDRGI